MKNKIAIYLTITLIFSLGALLAFPLQIPVWKALIVSLCSSLITSGASIVVAYLTHNGKPKTLKDA